jgi:hypothetical protein
MSVYGNAYQWGGGPSYGTLPIPKAGGRAWFVDATNGLDGNSGKSPKNAFASIGQAVEDNPDLQEFDTVYVFPKTMLVTDTDPGNYAETFTISTPQISLIGIGAGPVQASLPQVKIGAGTTAMCTIAAPGVTIQGIGFNGASSTGGGIKINEISSGLVIRGCHFKNCACHATNGTLGGAIYWTASGGGWQTLIEDNRFYKNVADIVMLGTGSSVPQDVVIRGNIFGGPAANVDVNILVAADGINGLFIHDNLFTCIPNVSSGTNATILKLGTGTVGGVTKNFFCAAGEAFGAAQANVVPTTVLFAGNWSEDGLEARV